MQSTRSSETRAATKPRETEENSTASKVVFGCGITLAALVLLGAFFLAWLNEAISPPSVEDGEYVAHTASERARERGIPELKFRPGGSLVEYGLKDNSIAPERYLEICEAIPEILSFDKRGVSMNSDGFYLETPSVKYDGCLATNTNVFSAVLNMDLDEAQHVSVGREEVAVTMDPCEKGDVVCVERRTRHLEPLLTYYFSDDPKQLKGDDEPRDFGKRRWIDITIEPVSHSDQERKEKADDRREFTIWGPGDEWMRQTDIPAFLTQLGRLNEKAQSLPGFSAAGVNAQLESRTVSLAGIGEHIDFDDVHPPYRSPRDDVLRSEHLNPEEHNEHYDEIRRPVCRALTDFDATVQRFGESFDLGHEPVELPYGCNPRRHSATND